MKPIQRKIIHIDMDAFFASVEQLDDASLRGKPIAVGGNADRGVIAAASYEARVFGVKSAMSSKIAAKRCPSLIFVRPRFERYKEISTQIQTIFRRYTDEIEPLSLDEAYLDVTFNKIRLSSATFIAQSIKNDIKNELGLVASAGVSYNKFLAKMASDQDKPDGLFVIQPKDALSFIDRLPIERFFGVGKVTAHKMRELGVTNGLELRNLSLEELQHHFGKSGSYFYQVCRGEDPRLVESHRERKSIAVETTFENDIFDVFTFRVEAEKIANKLWERYQRYGQWAKTVNIKLKFNDFTQITRSQTLTQPIDREKLLKKSTAFLTEQVLPLHLPARLIGFQISNFVSDEKADESAQLTMGF
jgi:DNA polymerase-4